MKRAMIVTVVLGLGLIILPAPIQANPFNKAGHAVTKVLKKIGKGLLWPLEQLQWPTER